MAGSTWNPSDKSANVTLSGSNLIATSSGALGWARSVDSRDSGKWYWEFRPTVWSNGNSGHGIVRGGVATPDGTAAVSMFAVFRSGNIWFNGANTGSTLGARAAGDIIGIAIDLGGKLGWFRVAPSGNWNGSGTANPATGVGGINLAAITGLGIPTYPVASFGANLESCTANFGDTAFSGTVPSGFTSGFTAGATVANNALVTQVAIEEWASVATAAVPTPRQYAVTVVT